MGMVAAKGGVLRNLLLGEEVRGAEMRLEVNEAKPRSTPLDVGQHRPEARFGDRMAAKRVLEDSLRFDEALALGERPLSVRQRPASRRPLSGGHHPRPRQSGSSG